MNNFINVRLQAYNHKKQLNLLKHNTRKIKSLSEQNNSKNNYIILNDGELVSMEEKELKDSLYNAYKDFYNKDRKEHNEKMYARRQRNLTNEQATWLEGIFTFSEAIHSDLGTKYTKEELSKVALNCARELAKQNGTELRYMVLHQDETTPHFHFALKNFDDSGHSIFHKIKHKHILQQIQDLAFKHFGKLGMKRGVSKEITGKNYQTINNYYIQQNIQIRAIKSDLKSEIKGLQKVKKDILADSELSKAEKKIELDKLDLEIKNKRNTIKEYNDLEKEFDAKIKAKNDEILSKDEELKTKNQEIDVANNTLNKLNKEITEKTIVQSSKRKLKTKIANDIKNIIENSTNSFGVFSKNKLVENLEKEFNEYSKLDFHIEENYKLSSDLEEAHTKNDNLTKSLNDEIQAKNSLADTLDKTKKSNSNLESKNQEQERDLKVLSNVLLGDSDDIQNANAIKVARKYYQDLDIRDNQKDIDIKERER